jgi:sugar lactone lactonase YvrE
MNDWRYTLVEDWEQLPSGYKHASAPDVAVDSHDRIYLLARKDPRVIVYEPDGTFVMSWGEGLFQGRTHGITIGPDDSVYVADDVDHIIYKCTTDGQVLMTIGTRGAGSDTGYDITRKSSFERMLTITHGGPPFNRCTALAVAPNGELYVSDGYGNARVHRFTAGGKLIQSWGEPGTGPSQFYLPHGICVVADGRVLVADRENDRIQIFTPDGKYLEEWTDLRRPADVFIDHEGFIWVPDLGWDPGRRSVTHGSRDLAPRVNVYDSKGTVVARWESAPGGPLDYFDAPHGMCVDSQGAIYLASNNNSGRNHASPARGGAIRPDYYTLQKFARV